MGELQAKESRLLVLRERCIGISYEHRYMHGYIAKEAKSCGFFVYFGCVLRACVLSALHVKEKACLYSSLTWLEFCFHAFS